MKPAKWMLSTAAVLFILLSKTVSAESLNANLDKIKAFFTNPRPPQNHVTLLFVQEADSGAVNPLKNKPGCYTLSLSNLHQHILYFTDQPKRKAGKISVSQFVDIWQHNNVTPNIALNAFAVSPEEVHEINWVAVLKNPRYDEKHQLFAILPARFPKSRISCLQWNYAALTSSSMICTRGHHK